MWAPPRIEIEEPLPPSAAMTPSLIETVSSALRLRQKLWFCPARGTKGLKQSGKRLAGRLNPASCPAPSRDGSKAGLAYKPRVLSILIAKQARLSIKERVSQQKCRS